MSKIVKKTPADIKPSANRRRELARLAAMPDSSIDLSDIPEAPEEFWRNAVRNPFYRRERSHRDDEER
jgi:hypothetical protein